MLLSPKVKRTIGQVIPFGVIWLLIGWYNMITEALVTGNKNLTPDSSITLTPTVFIFASLAVTIVGLLVGTIEMLWLKNTFSQKSFSSKLLLKLGLYTLIMLIIISITYPMAASIELELPIYHERVWAKFANFLGSLTFLSTLLSMSVSLFCCFFYAGISENLGHGVLVNFFTGKYHQPKEEERIFMFLDMRASTTVAEKLGHTQYFDLLKEYYSDLSEGIIRHSGEVYQYIGDEIIVTWKYKQGLKNNNCINSFFAMKKDLDGRKDFYLKKYGIAPTFKAGIHLGKATTGEIGALKKEIFFLGDLLNTTARIQGLCNDYQEDLIISQVLADKLHAAANASFRIVPLGEASLKGRVEPLAICKVLDTP